MKWLGTLSSIIGAFLVATLYAKLGYVFFMVGSIAWLWVGIKSRDNPLALLNFVFLVANIIGLYNHL
jgi:hypothetical protein